MEMTKLYMLLLLLGAFLVGAPMYAQTLTSYDLNPGPPGTTPVPQSAEWDAVAGEPLLKFKAGSYYVEALYSDLESFRNGTTTLSNFWINNAIKLNSTTTGQPLQLYRMRINFSDTKGLFFAQANNTTSRNYIYKTDGKGLLTTNPSSQLTLDDLDLLDSIGRLTGPINFQDLIIFGGGTPLYGNELMIMDSTYNVTIIDINAAPSADANPTSFFNWGDSVLLFSAQDSSHGAELWRTDGSRGGTYMVKDINTAGSSAPGKFISLGNKIYFTADDGSGVELWITDGTETGTVKVADLNSSASAAPNSLTAGPGGLLFFTATATNGERRLYKTDGTSGGTSVVTTAFAPAVYGAEYEVLDGKLYFFGYPVANDTVIHMYRTDGTAAGTELFYQVYTGHTMGYGVFNSASTAKSNGYIYFIGNDSVHDFEIYRTDGTTTGTIRATDFTEATTGYHYHNYLTPIPGGGVFFYGYDSIIGNELRVLDLGLGVGILSPEANHVLNIYPNPTQSIINIEVANAGEYQLSLLDITGKLVATQTLTADNGQLQFTRPTHAAQAGVYFLNIRNADGASQTVKVVYY